MFCSILVVFFFSSRRRHTRCALVTSSDVCSSDLRWFGAVRGNSGGRLFAFWRRRRKAAVRNLRRAVAGEHYERANIWPFVFGYDVAAFVDLGMLGIERFILSLEAQDHILIGCVLDLFLDRLQTLFDRRHARLILVAEFTAPNVIFVEAFRSEKRRVGKK